MPIFEQGSLPVDVPARVRQSMNLFPCGTTMVAGLVEDRPRGLMISHFASVSIGPPLVAIFVATTSSTWPLLRELPRLGISVIGEDVDPTLLYTKGIDRFAEVEWESTEDGAVLVRGSSLWIDCSLEQITPMGTHDLAVLRIERMQEDPSVQPLLWHSGAFRRIAPGNVHELVQAEDIAGLMERSRGRTTVGLGGEAEA
jgi:flavin reductase (DIM6/NTAB) family NADH-FMN oxidoreductase RutF